jgi:DNA invertase Pin-like site-specific DNA recombinase
MAAPAPALPRFVELVRVSSAGQADRDTPQDQRAALERLRVFRPGALVERIEVADGISGALAFDRRPDLRRLRELAEARAFDELRVRHLDRLTRHPDLRERAAILGLVADAGAIIVDAAGSVVDPATDAGEISYVLHTRWAAQERRRIQERTRAAKDRLVREGRLVNGRPPYGRTWDRKKGWGIDEPTAAVYRRMFELCLEGESLRRIAARLTSEGSTTPLGSDWTPAHVSRLLREPAAKGVYVTQGVEVQIPAVVDAETWDAAGARLRANNHLSGPRPRTPALLRKLLVCGECGAPMYVTKGGKEGSRRFYYYCSSGGSCSTYHQVAVVDDVVREAIAAFLRRPAALRSAAGRERPQDDGERAEAEIADARRELRDLDRQEERVARLLRRRLISAKVGEGQLEEVVRLRAAAEAALAGAQARAEAAARREEAAVEIEARVAALRAKLDAATPDDWRALLEVLFPRAAGRGVRIFPDGQIRLEGALPMDDQGAAALERASPKPSGPSGAA